jgi:phosphoenolpyruvate carboxylase
MAVEKHRVNFQDLARRLSLSSRRQPPPAELLDWFENRRPLPEHVRFLEERYSKEPYRLVLALLADDFIQASKDDMKDRLLSDSLEPEKTQPIHIIQPFEIVLNALPEPAKYGRAMRVLRQLKVFGLHAARVDIREDSARLNRTLGEILRAIGDYPSFEHVSPKERRENSGCERAGPACASSRCNYETAETYSFQLIACTSNEADLLGPLLSP